MFDFRLLGGRVCSLLLPFLLDPVSANKNFQPNLKMVLIIFMTA